MYPESNEAQEVTVLLSIPMGESSPISIKGVSLLPDKGVDVSIAFLFLFATGVDSSCSGAFDLYQNMGLVMA